MSKVVSLAAAALITMGTGPAEGASTESDTPRFEVASSDPVEHGERLSAVLGCVGCHRPDLTGEDWSEPELGVLWTANLTRSAARYSEAQLTAMIVEGKRPDRALVDMPSALFTELHPDDVAALVAYLKTLEPTGEIHPDPTIGPQLAREIEAGEFKNAVQMVAETRGQWPPDMGEEHAYGRFIVRATCAECHGMDLRGGQLNMEGVSAPVDLGVVAAYSREDFRILMEEGKPIGDRELTLMGGVARWRYSRFTDAEEKAVYEYLQAAAQRAP